MFKSIFRAVVFVSLAIPTAAHAGDVTFSTPTAGHTADRPAGSLLIGVSTDKSCEVKIGDAPQQQCRHFVYDRKLSHEDQGISVQLRNGAVLLWGKRISDHLIKLRSFQSDRHYSGVSGQCNLKLTEHGRVYEAECFVHSPVGLVKLNWAGTEAHYSLLVIGKKVSD